MDDTGAGTERGDLPEEARDMLERLRLPRLRRIGLAELCGRVSEERGREIQLVPMELPDQVTGVWLSTTNGVDYIAFEKRLAPAHQKATVLHEVGHGICKHRLGPVIDLNAITTWWPSLSPSMVEGVLGRDHSDTLAERQAEYVGTVLASRTHWTADLTRRMSGDQDVLDLAARLSALFAPRS